MNIFFFLLFIGGSLCPNLSPIFGISGPPLERDSVNLYFSSGTIRLNPYAEILDLSRKRLMDYDLLTFSQNLQHCPLLKELNLEENNFTSLGLSFLKKSFQTAPSLVDVNIKKNEAIHCWDVNSFLDGLPRSLRVHFECECPYGIHIQSRRTPSIITTNHVHNSDGTVVSYRFESQVVSQDGVLSLVRYRVEADFFEPFFTFFNPPQASFDIDTFLGEVEKTRTQSLKEGEKLPINPTPLTYKDLLSLLADHYFGGDVMLYQTPYETYEISLSPKNKTSLASHIQGMGLFLEAIQKCSRSVLFKSSFKPFMILKEKTKEHLKDKHNLTGGDFVASLLLPVPSNEKSKCDQTLYKFYIVDKKKQEIPSLFVPKKEDNFQEEKIKEDMLKEESHESEKV